MLLPYPMPNQNADFFSITSNVKSNYGKKVIQVMIFTQFMCGKYGKLDLHADFVCTFIFPY